MRVVFTAAFLALLGIAVFVNVTSGADHIRITALNCESNPEVVSIKNLGSAPQSLAGWKLRSDPVDNAGQVFDLSEIGSLDAGEEISVFSGSNAPATNASLGQYRWALSFKLRNDDPTDFAQILDDGLNVVDQLNCGDEPPTPETPTLMPTSTAPATASPSATPMPTETATVTSSPPATPPVSATPTPPAPPPATPSPTAPLVPTQTPTTTPARLAGDANCDDTVNAIDSAFILQFSAALLGTLPCADVADVNNDGVTNPLDAALILQFSAGLLDSLPPWRAPLPLQVHHIDTEQGDAALIISPGGETAMVDDGDRLRCSNVISYLGALSITSIDYHFASHYHADHIGCLDDMAAAGITVAMACYDRGGSYDSATFDAYVATCADKRQTVTQGQVITLDEGTVTPVTITVVALDGAGVTTSDENAVSLVLRLSYGSFDEVLAGDLTGEDPDVESVVAPQVGDVEVYKVNHHGSRFSTNDAWLDEIQPEVAVISTGVNTYGHPTANALERLHDHGIHAYWTNEGSGEGPNPAWDQVGGDIVIEALPGLGAEYTVSGEGFTDAYINE